MGLLQRYKKNHGLYRSVGEKISFFVSFIIPGVKKR